MRTLEKIAGIVSKPFICGVRQNDICALIRICVIINQRATPFVESADLTERDGVVSFVCICHDIGFHAIQVGVIAIRHNGEPLLFLGEMEGDVAVLAERIELRIRAFLNHPYGIVLLRVQDACPIVFSLISRHRHLCGGGIFDSRF